jgi:hypothetical protein
LSYGGTDLKDGRQACMKRKIGLGATMAIVAVSSLLVGCDRTVSRTEKTEVRSDGTVKSKDTKVTESPDGTVTKTEETKKTSPNP